MQQGFFDVTPAELAQLGPAPAVDVLREMVWAEVSSIGIPISDTDVPFDVHSADGGIDAIVKAVPTSAGNGLIFAPRTAYQVKTGDFALSATAPAQIEKLLIRPVAIEARIKAKQQPSGKSYKLEDLSPRIRDCLDNDGTFVTLLFGNDGIDTEEDATVKAIGGFLADIEPRYSNAKIKVWRQRQICGLLRKFPAVSLRLKNLAGIQLISHSQWAERQEVSRPFMAAPQQEKAIKELRAAIRDDSQGSIHVRLTGEPGIGKTRLIFETLRADDLRPLVCYADRATKAADPQVLGALDAARGARIILVVDECSPEQRTYLAKIFGSRGPDLKIISIYQEQEESDRASDYRLFEVPFLPDHEIEQILISYGNDPATAKNWSPYCEGSPRVAHVIGFNLITYPDDPLRPDGTSQIWLRYIAAGSDPKSDEYLDRHLVLCCLALFKRFGWGPPVRTLAYEIYDQVVVKLDTGMSRAKFGSIIDEMCGRKVLQGDNFLYITPKALHIKLWIDWWRQYGAATDVNTLVAALSSDMRQWFVEMIEYADAAPVAKQVVAQFLGPSGPYADAKWLNSNDGSRFFFSLALADPHGALRLLERTVGRMDRETLLGFGPGRRNVIGALENLALYGDLFRPSANLLLALAEAENETWSNNATGVFSGLFSLGYGDTAPTSLAPEHRLSVLTSALTANERRAELALKGFDQALSIRSITRFGGDPPFRLKKRVERWLPKTYGEWFDAYRLYLRTLQNELKNLPGPLRERAIDIILSHARELMAVENLSGDALDTIVELSQLPQTDKRKIIAALEAVLKYEKGTLSPDAVSRLVSLRDEMVGTSFHSRLQRYAGMDLLEDQFDQEGREIDRTENIIRDLAEEALATPGLLRDELGWLVTHEAKNGYRFGHALSQLDASLQMWPEIREAYLAAGGNAHDYFVGGYLRAVFERAPQTWETIIEELADGSRMHSANLPGLVWRSGMSDKIAMLVLRLVQAEIVSPQSLGIFGAARATEGLSDATFAKLLEGLMSLGSFSASATALHLASMSLFGGRSLTREQLEKLLTQPALFESDDRRSDVMLSHYWLQLSRSLVKLDRDAEKVVLRALIGSMANSGPITAGLGPEGERFLDDLVSKHPSETWRIASEYIKPPMDIRGFVITRWLRGDKGFDGRDPGPMRHIPRSEIWSWIQADTETRSAYVASMAPKDFTADSWQGSLIREVLCEFGDSDRVQNAALSNFFTGGWVGPASTHYATEKQALTQLRSKETNPSALRFLSAAIGATDEGLQRAKIEEEARGF